nr:MAG TPA: hypothetical protein [Caudoviricetes sp.]
MLIYYYLSIKLLIRLILLQLPHLTLVLKSNIKEEKIY